MQLRTTGPGVVDHNNCTLAGSDETWYMDGQRAADGTIFFESCNMGGFSTQGSMRLDAGNLSGQVSCYTKNGLLSVTFTAGN